MLWRGYPLLGAVRVNRAILMMSFTTQLHVWHRAQCQLLRLRQVSIEQLLLLVIVRVSLHLARLMMILLLLLNLILNVQKCAFFEPADVE